MFRFKRDLFRWWRPLNSQEHDRSYNFYSSQNQLEHPRVLLVIAHPDDEAMFFGPTLCCLDPSQTFVLCLSNGNADGLGSIREEELLKSCSQFGIQSDCTSIDSNGARTRLNDSISSSHPSSHVRIINSVDLPDSMTLHWETRIVRDYVLTQVKLWNIDVIVTFDEGGVSGHINHIDAYRGVVSALRYMNNTNISYDCTDTNGFSSSELDTKYRRPTIIGYKLLTVNIFRKFSGILELTFVLLLSRVWVYANLWKWCQWVIRFVCNYLPLSKHPWCSSDCATAAVTSVPCLGAITATPACSSGSGDGTVGEPQQCLRAHLSLCMAANNASRDKEFDISQSLSLQQSDCGNQLRLLSYRDIFRAMRCHASQLVWYRRIFILISCYSYINTLYAIKLTEGDDGPVHDTDGVDDPGYERRANDDGVFATGTGDAVNGAARTRKFADNF